MLPRCTLAPLTVLVSVLMALAGCGGSGTGSGGGSTHGGTTTGAGGAGTGGAGGSGQGGNIIFTDGGTEDAPSDANPCFGMQCPADQHCAPAEDGATCVNNTCADLACSATEACQATPGGGAICKDISCTSDANCPITQWCNGTICMADVCAPNARACVGQELHQCQPNGGGDVAKYTCGSQSYFTSTCTDPGQGDASCGCEDDWDCPANTTCEVGVCTGTGKAPTCTLAPQPFSSVLPTNEIQWGGTGLAQKDALGRPFPLSSQSCTSPMVANLDDDNGDGLINELDFPEIIFMTYCASDVTNNGIIRAIHGGGPNKGKDMWATCGNTVWHEGDDLALACPCANAIGNSTAVLAVGDLDGDGVPEIVVPTETAGLQILDNKGNPITTSAPNQWAATPNYVDPAPSIANLDNQGFAEIVVGAHVFTLGHDAAGKLVFLDRFDGAISHGLNGQGPVPCVANVAGDSQLEVVAGTTVYRLPAPPPGVTKRADCAVGATDNFCKGLLDVVWDGQTVNGATKIPSTNRDGFCAVADILGVDPSIAPGPANPLDGKAEVIVVSKGKLLILDGETGTLLRFVDLNAGAGGGGAPNVDDFDGDGFPEVGVAFGLRYVVYDLQDPTAACPAWPTPFDDKVSGMQGNPARTPGGACTADADCAAGAMCNKSQGTCLCQHNGWMRVTEDNSSAVTASSVFDFNGDGAAEVVYNDECYFRIYDGATGSVLFKHHNPSRTRIEHPVIADVDNDGNAEIVFTSNNEVPTACSEGADYPNGLQVWGDASDTWVSARRIWNQHAYHVTNVTEAGGIPVKEPESWKTYNGRRYNTYRSNPRSFGIAPDLQVKGVQVSSPDATCGQLSTKLDITVQIDNAGDLRVGPGVVVTFYGTWTTPALSEPLYGALMASPITATLQSSIEPGGSLLVTVSYDAANNAPGTLPDTVRVVVDEANQERECVETNNELTAPVDPGMPRADLRIDLGSVDQGACPDPTVQTTIFNDGSAPASNVVVRYYAGDPSQGGTVLHEQTVAGPIAAGASTSFTATIVGFPKNLVIQLYGVVDPDNAIAECNDGNNEDLADNKILCNSLN